MKQIIAYWIHKLGLTGLAPLVPLSPVQFTSVFADVLQTSLPQPSVTIKGDLEIAISTADGKESTIYLDNAYTQYMREPRDYKEVMRIYLTSFLETRNKSDSIDPERIVPVIKDRDWMADIQASVAERDGKKVQMHVYDEYNDDLVIIYAEDTPSNINYFTPEEFDKLGIVRDNLRKVAVENLRRLLPEPDIEQGELASMITAGGDYEASLLLFDDIWSSIDGIDGEIVAVIPSRDVLLFTGSNNQAGVNKLRQLAQKFATESAYRLTDRLFVYRDNKFVRFD